MSYSVLTPGLTRINCLEHVAAAADQGLGGVNDLPHDISSAKVVADALVDDVTYRFSFWDRTVQDLEDSRKMIHVKRKKKEIHASNREEQGAEMCHERHTPFEVKGCTIAENVKTAHAGCKKKESLTMTHNERSSTSPTERGYKCSRLTYRVAASDKTRIGGNKECDNFWKCRQ